MSERQAVNLNHPEPLAEDPKRALILKSAFAVVLRYGYQRMTMDDVAKEAGISRPALYLQFKNKADIYRALTQGIMGRALENAACALEGEGGLEERLFASIKAGILDPTQVLLASAHGAELLDMKHNMAGDIMQNWRKEKGVMLARAIDAGGAGKGLTGQQLADILLDGLEGLKARVKDIGELREGARALVKLVAG